MLTITYYQTNIPNPSFLELDTLYAKALCAASALLRMKKLNLRFPNNRV